MKVGKKKIKNPKITYSFLVIISLVILSFLNPLTLNIGTFLGLGPWDIQKSYEYEDLEGTLNLIAKMRISNARNLRFGIYEEDFFYSTNLIVSTSGNFQQADIGSTYYEFFRNGIRIDIYNISDYYENIIISKRIKLYQNDRLSCKGSTNITFMLNNINQEQTFNFEVEFTQNLDPQVAYIISIFQIAITYLFFGSYIIIPLILYFIIKPDILSHNSEEKERDEKFWEKIENRNKSLKEENGN